MVDHTSKQSVQVVFGKCFHELQIELGLEYTAGYDPGFFHPDFGGEPPSGPEFEIETIQVQVVVVNLHSGEPERRPPLDLDWYQLIALVGQDIASNLFDEACNEAAESGEF